MDSNNEAAHALESLTQELAQIIVAHIQGQRQLIDDQGSIQVIDGSQDEFQGDVGDNIQSEHIASQSADAGQTIDLSVPSNIQLIVSNLQKNAHLLQAQAGENEDFVAGDVQVFVEEEADSQQIKPRMSEVSESLGTFQAEEDISVNQGSFQCNTCGRGFSLKKYLARHISMVHSDAKPFKCKICSKSFKSSGSLKKHLIIHADHKPYKCSECDRGFSQKVSLQRHMPTHLPGTLRPFMCQICGKCYTSADILRRHINVHNEERPYECEICSKRFKHRISLKYHVKLHADNKVLESGEKAYICHICNTHFDNKYELRKHSRIHDPDRLLPLEERKRHACEQCGKRFTQKSNLGLHVRLKHSSQDGSEVQALRRVACSDCGKWFSKKSNLKAHMRLHTGLKQFACNFCGKLCSRWTDHMRHYEKRHKHESLRINDFLSVYNPKTYVDKAIQTDPIPPGNCDACEKPIVLVIHDNDNSEGIHQDPMIQNLLSSCESSSRAKTKKGFKGHCCLECGKFFQTRKSLKRHSEDSCRRYTCNVCGEVCARQSDFKSHMKSHKDKPMREKTHACVRCPKKFTTLKSLERHLALHDTTYTCNLCGDIFPLKYDYNRHMKSDHAA